jgi:four helix bundle protein
MIVSGPKSYRDLKVWQLGMELARKVYRFTRTLPESERYGLSGQSQRASVSIPTNVAEGHARDSTKEYARHVSIALGSLAELETHILLAQSLYPCDESMVADLLDTCEREGRMLHALQKSLKIRIRTRPETRGIDPGLPGNRRRASPDP